MASLGSLRVFLGADDAQFQKKMRAAQFRIKAFRDTHIAAARRIGRVALLGAGAATAATALLYKLTKATADAGDQFDKMRLRTGMSAKSLSEFAFAAEISGTEVMTFQKAMKSLARFVSYAKDGIGTYTRELDKMGISTAELEGLAPEDALDLFIQRIREMPDALQQSATAQVVFGRAGQELMPLIKSSTTSIAALRKEARDLGIVFDDEAAAKGARFNDALIRIKSALAGVRNDAVLSFIDSFSNGLESITEKIKVFRQSGAVFDWLETGVLTVNNMVAGMETLVARTRFWIDLFREDFPIAAQLAADAAGDAIVRTLEAKLDKSPMVRAALNASKTTLATNPLWQLSQTDKTFAKFGALSAGSSLEEAERIANGERERRAAEVKFDERRAKLEAEIAEIKKRQADREDDIAAMIQRGRESSEKRSEALAENAPFAGPPPAVDTAPAETGKSGIPGLEALQAGTMAAFRAIEQAMNRERENRVQREIARNTERTADALEDLADQEPILVGAF